MRPGPYLWQILDWDMNDDGMVRIPTGDRLFITRADDAVTAHHLAQHICESAPLLTEHDVAVLTSAFDRSVLARTVASITRRSGRQFADLTDHPAMVRSRARTAEMMERQRNQPSPPGGTFTPRGDR